MRTFIAVELPDEVSRHLAALQTRLQTHGLNLRWVKPSNIHLTLKFLGDVAPDDIEGIVNAMGAAADQTPAFELTVQGLGVFPGMRRPKVLWTGLGGAPDQLAQMHRVLDEALAGQGVEREKRPFKGHLTLGRFKKKVDTGQVIQAVQEEGMFDPLRLPVKEMVLFQSRLRPTGAEYSPLDRRMLKIAGH